MTAIGQVPLSQQIAARAYVLTALQGADYCSVEQLVTGLCGSCKPAKLADKLSQLDISINGKLIAVRCIPDLADVMQAQADFEELSLKKAELDNACRAAARDLISRLVQSRKIIVKDGVARLVKVAVNA